MAVASDMTTHEGRANFRNAIRIARVTRRDGEEGMIPLNPQLVLELLDRLDEIDPPPRPRDPFPLPPPLLRAVLDRKGARARFAQVQMFEDNMRVSLKEAKERLDSMATSLQRLRVFLEIEDA